MHGICTEKFRLTAVEFYPELAKVGKGLGVAKDGQREEIFSDLALLHRSEGARISFRVWKPRLFTDKPSKYRSMN